MAIWSVSLPPDGFSKTLSEDLMAPPLTDCEILYRSLPKVLPMSEERPFPSRVASSPRAAFSVLLPVVPAEERELRPVPPSRELFWLLPCRVAAAEPV